jgi:hypothetical protein
MESDPAAGAFAGLLVLVFFLGLYFLPSIVAIIRKREVAAILLLNLFLGWTFLGWIIALIWAFTEKQQHTTIVNNVVASPGPSSQS